MHANCLGGKIILLFFAGICDEGDADFEICFDCSMQNLDTSGAEDFVWKVLVDGANRIKS